MYISLINKTEYSLKESTITVPQLLQLAKENKMPYIGVAESGVLFSTMELYTACKKDEKNQLNLIKEGKLDKQNFLKINPIIGMKTFIGNKNTYINVICKNYLGYTKLIKIATKSQKNKIDEVPVVSNINDLVENKEQFFVLSGNIITNQLIIKKDLEIQILYFKNLIKHFEDLKDKSEKMLRLFSDQDRKEIAKKLAIYKKDIEKLQEKYENVKSFSEDYLYENAKKIAIQYKNNFGSNFFIEISNHNEELELYANPFLIKLSKELDIPLVATQVSYYSNKNNKKAKDILSAIDNKTVITDKTLLKDNGEYYFKNQKEMEELFKDIPKAIENTWKIAQQCSFEFEHIKHFPNFDIPKEETVESYLRKTTLEGFSRKFNFLSKEEKEIRMNRIEEELNVINDLHYSEYILIVSDFLKYARKIGMVGPGRGSAVGSIVCYLNDITNVDPIKYGLFFERFLNRERVSDPDIDSDFDNKREDVITYCKEKYGSDHVCQIITFGTMSARKAIRDVGRSTNKSLSLCDRIAKLIPAKPGVNIKKALGIELNKMGEKYEEFYSPDLEKEFKTNLEVKELIEDTLLVEGLKVQTGIHAAGVIIANQTVSNLVPLYYDEEEDKWMTQYDKGLCENPCGLLKMDFLGLENLTIMKRAKMDIMALKNKNIEPNNFPLDDNKIYEEIFQKGNTKGVFQFESQGMRQLLRKFKPSNIEDIILLNAVYRPGPIQYIDDIIDVKNGNVKPDYIVPELADICDETYGKPVYQEQIMQIFNKIGGFTLGTADIIRRAMSKKKFKELESYMPQFKNALIKKGANEKRVEKFCNELMEFAKYAFNKSHSTAYAIVAYQTAYFKYYYTSEYIASLLTSAKEIEDIASIINECRNLNIKILNPNVNKSLERFLPLDNNSILYGLEKIKNVGKSATSIVNTRKNSGIYTNIIDFIERNLKKDKSAFNIRTIKSLTYTGAFDCFNDNMTKAQISSGVKDYMEDSKLKVTLESQINELQNLQLDLFTQSNICQQDYNYLENFLKDVKYLIDKIKTAKTLSTKKKAIEKYKNSYLSNKFSYNGTLLIDIVDKIISDNNGLDIFIKAYENLKGIKRYYGLIDSRICKLSEIEEKEYFPYVVEESSNFLLEQELKLMGYYYSGHPLDMYQNLIKSQNTTLICDINEDNLGEYISIIGRMKNYKKAQRKSDSADMCFFDLEDTTGEMHVCCFTKSFENNKNFFLNENCENKIVKIVAKVNNSNETMDDSLQLFLESICEVTNNKLYIKCSRNQLDNIKEYCKDNSGSVPVYVFIKEDKKLYLLNDIYVDINLIKENLSSNNIEYILK